MGFSLSEQSPSEWPSFREKTEGDDEVVAEDLFSILTLAPLCNLN